MEIRSISKKTQKTKSDQEAEADQRKSGDKQLALEKPKSVKDSAQKEAQQWAWLMSGLGFAFLLGNPWVGTLITILAGVKITQHDQQIRQERKQILDELNLSLQQSLPSFFKSLSKKADIKSLLTDSQYSILSFLISLESSPNLALASLALTPAYQGEAQVFYDYKKKQLAYKKPKIRTRYFSPEPLEKLIKDLKTLESNEPALDTSSLIYILVLSDTITLSDSRCDQLGEVRYLHLNGIYIVEKSGLETLMTHLISPQLESLKVAVPSSEKEATSSKPQNRLVKQSSGKSQPKTQKRTPKKSQAKTQTKTQPKSETDETTTPSVIIPDLIGLSEAEQDNLIQNIFPNLKEYITYMGMLYFLFSLESSPHPNLFSLCFFRTKFGENEDFKAGRKYSLAIQEEAVYRLYSLLHEKLSYCGMKIYARWNYPDESLKTAHHSQRPDLMISVPPNLVYVIAVKSLVSTKDKTVKIFYDTAVETLRYRKGNRGKQNFIIDPITESNERVNWLISEYPSLVPNEPIQIIVFANPIDLKLHRETPTESFAKRKAFIHHNNAYIVKENKLVSLIRFLTHSKTSKNSPKNS